MRRFDFPLLQKKMRGKPLVYLDNSGSTQKPLSVMNAVTNYYANDHANVHRGIYELGERASHAYESARKEAQCFINAPTTHEIIFTRGTTEAINLVADSLGRLLFKAGDEILVSEMEHHANIIPWQILCEKTGAQLRIIPVLDDGSLDQIAYANALNDRTRLVALTHVSNVLGVVNPVKEMIALAHQAGAAVLLDGAQAVGHFPVDVQDLDCDFYVFSGHKLYGPTGIGVLYGKTQWLERMPPYQTGGGMVQRVSFEKTEFLGLPNKFEAGTPHTAGAVGLQAAIHFIRDIGFSAILDHERQLTQYAIEQLKNIPGLRWVGDPLTKKIGVLSFVLSKAHPHDIATILDSDGIAIRAGHHCAMPLMERFSVAATARISLGLYNDEADIDRVVMSLQKVLKLFGV